MKRRSFFVIAAASLAATRLSAGPVLAAVARERDGLSSVGIRRHAFAAGVPGSCANRRRRAPGAAYTLDFALAGLRL